VSSSLSKSVNETAMPTSQEVGVSSALPPIVNYKPVKCEWAADSVRYSWCRKNCKLLGAAVCPRSLKQFSKEWWQKELEQCDEDDPLPPIKCANKMAKFGYIPKIQDKRGTENGR
jgi:hypothetical protein